MQNKVQYLIWHGVRLLGFVCLKKKMVQGYHKYQQQYQNQNQNQYRQHQSFPHDFAGSGGTGGYHYDMPVIPRSGREVHPRRIVPREVINNRFSSRREFFPEDSFDDDDDDDDENEEEEESVTASTTIVEISKGDGDKTTPTTAATATAMSKLNEKEVISLLRTLYLKGEESGPMDDVRNDTEEEAAAAAVATTPTTTTAGTTSSTTSASKSGSKKKKKMNKSSRLLRDTNTSDSVISTNNRQKQRRGWGTNYFSSKNRSNTDVATPASIYREQQSPPQIHSQRQQQMQKNSHSSHYSQNKKNNNSNNKNGKQTKMKKEKTKRRFFGLSKRSNKIATDPSIDFEYLNDQDHYYYSNNNTQQQHQQQEEEQQRRHELCSQGNGSVGLNSYNSRMPLNPYNNTTGMQKMMTQYLSPPPRPLRNLQQQIMRGELVVEPAQVVLVPPPLGNNDNTIEHNSSTPRGPHNTVQGRVVGLPRVNSIRGTDLSPIVEGVDEATTAVRATTTPSAAPLQVQTTLPTSDITQAELVAAETRRQPSPPGIVNTNNQALQTNDKRNTKTPPSKIILQTNPTPEQWNALENVHKDMYPPLETPFSNDATDGRTKPPQEVQVVRDTDYVRPYHYNNNNHQYDHDGRMVSDNISSIDDNDDPWNRSPNSLLSQFAHEMAPNPNCLIRGSACYDVLHYLCSRCFGGGGGGGGGGGRTNTSRYMKRSNGPTLHDDTIAPNIYYGRTTPKKSTRNWRWQQQQQQQLVQVDTDERPSNYRGYFPSHV